MESPAETGGGITAILFEFDHLFLWPTNMFIVHNKLSSIKSFNDAADIRALSK